VRLELSCLDLLRVCLFDANTPGTLSANCRMCSIRSSFGIASISSSLVSLTTWKAVSKTIRAETAPVVSGGEMCGIKLAALQIDQRLPKDEAVTVEFTPDRAGTFPFQYSVFCAMVT
jgi:hypothetical protein